MMKRKEIYILAVILVVFDAFLAIALVNTTYQQAQRIEQLEIHSTAQEKAIDLLKANVTKLYADNNNVGG